MPQIFIDGQHIGGCDISSWRWTAQESWTRCCGRRKTSWHSLAFSASVPQLHSSVRGAVPPDQAGTKDDSLPVAL